MDSGAVYTAFERASDEPDEVIRIYYDSRRNLVARGIIPGARPHGATDAGTVPAGVRPRSLIERGHDPFPKGTLIFRKVSVTFGLIKVNVP